MKSTLLPLFAGLAALLCLPAAFEHNNELFAIEDTALPAAALNGANAPFADSGFTSFELSKPYLAEGLWAARLFAALPYRGAGFSGEFAYFGTKGYGEYTARAGGGYAFGKIFSVGGGLSWQSFNINLPDFKETQNFFDVNISLRTQPHKMFSVGFALDNIKAFFDKDIYISPKLAVGIALEPFNGLMFRYNLQKDEFGFVNFAELRANLLPFCSISCGYARESMVWTASVTVLFGHAAARYTIKTHPYLKATHVFTITARMATDRLNALRYGVESGDEAIVKIDINACSDEEIQALPGLTEEQANRLIEYRKRIGPITEKALKQMGLTSAEAQRLQTYAYGFAEEEKKDEKTVRTKKNRNSVKNKAAANRIQKQTEQKDLFLALVEAGVPPAQALDISEAAKKGRAEALNALNAASGLPEDVKRKAASICENLQ